MDQVFYSLCWHGGHGGAGKTDGPIGLYGRNREGSPEVRCEEYDRRFRQMVAGDDSRPWARLDAGLYTECFTEQALTGPAARDTGRGRQAGQAAGPRKRPLIDPRT